MFRATFVVMLEFRHPQPTWRSHTMNTALRENFWARLLFVLLCLLPLVILFFLPSGNLLGGGLWFWVILLICFSVIWFILGGDSDVVKAQPEPELRMIPPEEQPAIVRELMEVVVATEQAGVRVFRGRLRESASAVYEKLKSAFSEQTVPLLQEDEQLRSAIVLMPKPIEEATLERATRPWVHWLLFGLTVLTTTWAGAAHQGVDLLQQPMRFAVGLPYSLGLLTILGVHELGHYFAARWHEIRVTPPFFIPVPFALGTFGAFIQMRSPTENRRALFDVAVAGPLAGLVIAVPALWIGLQDSAVIQGRTVEEATAHSVVGGASAGSSLLFALIAKAALPDALRHGYVLQLSPLAFAGWLGLLVTALNLLPIGQLDGGHTARAMFGQRIGSTISTVAMWSLLLLALFVWPGLLMWVLIVFFIAGRGTPPLNDLVPISAGRKWLGYATFAILILILVPLPHALWSEAGIYCPYVGPP
jgi:membrane-associated protease RseP (regulator of RpoE activity)